MLTGAAAAATRQNVKRCERNRWHAPSGGGEPALAARPIGYVVSLARRRATRARFGGAAAGMAARSAASLAKRRSRRRVTFAAAAARSSSTFVTISRDRIFIPDFGLRPSDIAHLPPLSIEPPRARQLAARTRALDRKRYNFVAIRASLVRHLWFVDLIVPRHRHSLMLLELQAGNAQNCVT